MNGWMDEWKFDLFFGFSFGFLLEKGGGKIEKGKKGKKKGSRYVIMIIDI